MIASCGFLEDELRQCSKGEGVTMAGRMETLGVDLRTTKEWDGVGSIHDVVSSGCSNRVSR